MAFKLKSPFNLDIKTEGKTLNTGGNNSGDAGNRLGPQGSTFIEMTDGQMEVKGEKPSNEVTERLTNQADEGMPLGLNPKQEARFKVKKERREMKDASKFERQTEQAKKIYKRNEFENVDGEYLTAPEADKKKTDNEIADKTEMFDRYDKAADNPDMIDALDSRYERGKYDPNYKAPDSEFKAKNMELLGLKNNIISPNNMNNMEKPNRAGRPANSGLFMNTEDKTSPMYKSVRAMEKENLMSNISSDSGLLMTAKDGGPEVNDFTANFDTQEAERIEIKPKQNPKKVKNKKKKGNTGSGNIQTRKVSVKF